MEVSNVRSKPDELIPENEKDREWILNNLKWMWDDYSAFSTNGSSNMFFSNRGLYKEIKEYAMGQQSINRYKPMMDVSEDQDEDWLNIDWSIIPIFPKFRRISLRKLNKVDYNITASPIDELAINERNDKYAKLKAKLLLKEEFENTGSELSKMPSLQPDKDEPKNSQELEATFDYTYKHKQSYEMEDAIKLIFFQNNMNDVRRKIKEDAFDNGVAIVREYIDSNGSIKIRRANPERFIISQCEKNDFSDKEYAGEVIEMSIGELKQRAQDQFSDDEYKDISSMVLGKYGNPKSIPYNIQDVSAFNDTLKIWVLDAEFFSVNDIRQEEFTDKRGNSLMGNSYVNKKGKLRGELRRQSYRVVYQGLWIVGTNYIFDYGLKTNMARAKDSLFDTDMSYKLYCPDFYKMQTTSISKQVMPICDQIQLDWYHLQNVKNKARPKGFAIEIGSLENVGLNGKGGQNMQPLELIDLFEKAGILVYRRLEANGGGQELRPIEELNNGIGSDASFYFDSIMANINLLQQISGLNDYTDAGNPNARSLTTIAKMAYEGTENALGHVLETDMFLLERLATDTLLHLQDLVSMGADVSGYSRAIGTNSMKFFKLSDNVSNYDFGIMLEDKPTDREKELFIQEAEKAMQSEQIRYSDLIYVRNMDNLKKAEMILAYRIERYEKQKQERSKELQAQNAKVQSASNQAAENEKRKTLQVEYELKTKYELEIENAKKMTQREKYRFELQKEQMGNETDVISDLINTDSKEYISQQKQGKEAVDKGEEDAEKILNRKI